MRISAAERGDAHDFKIKIGGMTAAQKSGKGHAKGARAAPILHPGLKSLVWPLAPPEFRDAYWGKKPFVSHGGEKRLRRLERDLGTLSLAALAESSESARAFFTTLRGDLKAIDISRANAVALYDAGMTVYLRTVTPLLPWADALARDLGMKGRGLTAAFASRAGSGVSFHFDYPETFTIQLRGRKRWRIAPNRHVRNPLAKWVAGTSPPPESLRFYCHDELPAEGPSTWETVELTPGSVLHLPAGYWHATEAIEDSVSIALTPPPDTWADLVIDGIRSLLLSRDEWRGRALGAWGNEPQRARARRHLGELMAGLGEEIQRLQPDDLVRPPRPKQPDVSRLYRRSPTATFGVEGTISRHAGDVALVRFIRKGLREIRERDAELEPASLDLCRWIVARRRPFTAEDAAAATPSLTVVDVLKLLELLLQVGLIFESPEPSSAVKAERDGARGRRNRP